MFDGLKKMFIGYGDAETLKTDAGDTLFVLAITIPVILFFSLFNAFYGFIFLSWMEAIIAIVLSLFLYFGRKGVRLPGFQHIIMAAPFVLFTFLFMDGGIGNLGVYWALVFPFLAFLLTGLKQGWRWIGAFMVVQGILCILHAYGLVALPYNQEALMVAPMMFVLFTLVGNLLELQNESHRFRLIQVNKQLKEKEEDLLDAYANLEHQVFQRTRDLQASNSQLIQEMKFKEQAIASMLETEKMLQHSQRMESVGTLVGGIAHDFNNMLSGITANLYLAQRHMESKDGKNRLDKIGDLSMHAADIINQLLTFARKDATAMNYLDLQSFMIEAFKLAKISVPENIECRSVFGHEKMLINGSTTQIQQMVMNLINNARDALTGVDNPTITVSLSKVMPDKDFCDRLAHAELRPYALLQVKDNGMGISESALDSVFDPFFTTKEVGKGTGLGLAMIYGAVQSHQGLIEVQSKQGEGTCFNLYFPLFDNVLDADGVSEDDQVVMGDGETILLVEDDDMLRFCHAELLEELGYNVLVAVNGVEGYELYQHEREVIALVLMDVVMPILDGVGSAKRIREICPDAKIIFSTGYDKAGGLDLKKEYVLKKPLQIGLLSVAIRERLDS